MPSFWNPTNDSGSPKRLVRGRIRRVRTRNVLEIRQLKKDNAELEEEIQMLKTSLGEAQSENKKLRTIRKFYDRLRPYAEFLQTQESDRKRAQNRAEPMAQGRARLGGGVEGLQTASDDRAAPQQELVNLRGVIDVLTRQTENWLQKYMELEVSSKGQAKQHEEITQELQEKIGVLEESNTKQRKELQDAEYRYRTMETAYRAEIDLLKQAAEEPKLRKWSTDLNHLKQQIFDTVQASVHGTCPNDLVKGAGIVLKMDDMVRSRLFGWLEDGVPSGAKRDPTAILEAINAVYDDVVQVDFVIREDLEHELKAKLARFFRQAVTLWSGVSQ